MHLKEKEKKPIIALLAEESERRTDAWLKTGCNAFDSKHPMSKPMSFWTEQDVLKYIKQNTLSIASVYGDVVNESQIVKSGNEIFEQQSMFEGCGGKLTTTGCKRTGVYFAVWWSPRKGKPLVTTKEDTSSSIRILYRWWRVQRQRHLATKQQRFRFGALF